MDNAVNLTFPDGGVTVPETIAEDVFYGFRLNPKTAHLDVEVIAGGNGVVRLPQENVIDPLDYKQWAWSRATLAFAFSTKGHLEVTIL